MNTMKSKAVVGPVIGVAIIGVLVLAVSSVMPRCGGADDAAMATLEDCAIVTSVLGADVQLRFGWSSGEASVSGDSGSASWSVPIRGTSESGRLRFEATKSNGRWRTTAAWVSVGDLSIDALTCRLVD